MNVYLVYWCNNETYEDYYESVRCAFSTREKAVEFIESEGYKPHVCEDEWERNFLAGRFDAEPNEWGEYYSMWVKEMEVDAP